MINNTFKSAADAPKTDKPHVAPPTQPETNPAPSKPVATPAPNSDDVKK
ncbi:MAG: hypothetical protein WAM55_05465 [Methylovirgula sp.]|jgi:hypothetical protein